MGLKIKWNRPGCADGDYVIRARGYLLAVLSWGRDGRPLEGWTPFAWVPIDPYGNGFFRFAGGRAIPSAADCVCAHCVSADFTESADLAEEIPERKKAESKIREHGIEDSPEKAVRISAFSDLHLSSLAWKIRRVFRAAEGDIFLLPGDLTNDGTAEQFALLKECVEETVSDKLILSVTGNHDILRTSARQGTRGSGEYFTFQTWLFNRRKTLNLSENVQNVQVTGEGAYSLQIGNIDLIGLQCVTEGRKFLFPEGEQIRWLENHLSEYPDASWHLILCHAPLLAHNPQRSEGNPYLDRNRELQELLNRNRRIIFLSGHTHVSPNNIRGNVEFDEVRNHIYLDDGSVVLTDISKADEFAPADWKDGVITELSISPDEVEIRMKSVSSGKNFSRGYYRFKTGKGTDSRTVLHYGNSAAAQGSAGSHKKQLPEYPLS